MDKVDKIKKIKIHELANKMIDEIIKNENYDEKYIEIDDGKYITVINSKKCIGV